MLKKVNGHKTTIAATAYILFEIIKVLKPDLFTPQIEHIILIVINSGILTGLIHKFIKFVKSKRKK